MTTEHDDTEAEILATITRRIGYLPRLTRAAFLLRRVDDLDYEQIAWRLNLSVRQVERRMAVAILMLTYGPRRPRWGNWWAREEDHIS